MAEAEAQDKKEANEEEPKQDFERIPLEWPGDGLPTKPTTAIVFKWNKEFKSRKECDTLHCIFLLQLALELLRLRTNDRNRIFKRLDRPDRYRKHLDAPAIITKFIDWHNEDREKHLFNGVFLETTERLEMVKLFCKITGLKLGPASDIYQKLMVDIEIQESKSLEPPKFKLEVFTYGYTKLYKGEKVIDECTKEELGILLEFENKDPENDVDDDGAPIQGVIAMFEAIEKEKGKQSQLRLEDNWQHKLVMFFIQNDIDGKALIAASPKKVCQQCMDFIIPPDTVNEKGEVVKNNKLRGGVMQVIRLLKGCYVHRILEAHARQTQ